jgi:hypothetical protein
MAITNGKTKGSGRGNPSKILARQNQYQKRLEKPLPKKETTTE